MYGRFLHLILLAFNALAIEGLSAISSSNQSASVKKENAIAFILVASQVILLGPIAGYFSKKIFLLLQNVQNFLLYCPNMHFFSLL